MMGARDDRRRVLEAALVLFAIMIAHALLETARDALFLARLGPDALAGVYLAMAAIALAGFTAIRRWAHVRDPRRVLVTFLAIAVAGTSVLATLVGASRDAVFVLYVWTGLVVTMIVPCFWTLLDRSMRIDAAKRTFAAIGAGGVIGAMLGSAAAAVLARALPSPRLVAAGAVAYAAALGVAIAFAPRAALVDPGPRRQHAAAWSRRSRRYVRLLIVLGFVSTIALTLGDLAFKRVVAERLPAGELGVAFGAIYTALNALGLVVQLALTPRLLARRGIGGALAVLPAILAATGLGFALSGAVIAIAALKLADGGLRHSLHRVGTEILYVAAPGQLRDATKPIADTLGLRGGEAAAALLVFALGALGEHARTLAGVAAAAAAVWLVAVAVTQRAYIAQFRASLRAGEIRRDGRAPELDAHAIDMLGELLASPDESEAIAAVDLLAWRRSLPALVFYHPSDHVVRHALSLLDGELRPDIVRVLGHLLDRADSRVRAAALAASARTGAHRDALIAALDERDPEVRAVACVHLAHVDGFEARAGRGIAALARGHTAERAALARALAYTADARFAALLHELATCGEPAVARPALHVLARIADHVDLERILPVLADPKLRDDARRVFLGAGRRGLARLVVALNDPATALEVRRHLPRSISRFRSAAAAAPLVERLASEGDGQTAFKLLRALGRMRADDPRLPLDEAALARYAQHELAGAARYATLHDAFGASPEAPGGALVAELLAEKRDAAIDRVFRAFGVIAPRAGLRSAHDALRGTDEARRAAARELVAAVLPAELRAPLLAVCEPMSPDERRRALGDLAPGPFASDEELFTALLADRSTALRCLAAYHAGERKLVGLDPELARLRAAAGTPLVAHALDQAIERLHA